MIVRLAITATGFGHRTVTFDADTEEGGKNLEAEVDQLIESGHTVLVTVPGEVEPLPVVGFDASQNAWITRKTRERRVLTEDSTGTVLKPLKGG